MPVAYNYEYPKKLRTGFIGCGGHAFRNVYPTFQYAPVNLVAVCDLNPALELLRIYEAYLQPDQTLHRTPE